MGKAFILVLLVALAGCSQLPRPYDSAVSPCAISKVSYECQVEQYHNVNVP